MLPPLLLLLAGNSEPPPGLVLIPGGRTQIGTELSSLERRLRTDESARRFASVLIAETPRHEVVVPDFHLMSTEVTQEQYAHFVRAGLVRPPLSWCEDAIRAASVAFVAEEERAAESARAAGSAVPARRAFDAREWWLREGARADWAVPTADRARPMVFVDFEDASRYARWAGLRLPSEFEFQRAVRGDGRDDFPWGDDEREGRLAAADGARTLPGAAPVASYAAGRSRQNVFDLAGNVWEWTHSRYAPYPGYELKVFEVGYGRERALVNALATWDERERVVVGGSYQDPLLFARASVRRGTREDETSAAIGLRCAASPRAGLDVGEAVLAAELAPARRPAWSGTPVAFAPERAVCARGWRTAKAPEFEGWQAPAAFAVIADHRHVSFVPVRQLDAADSASLARASIDVEPLYLGFLSTNVELSQPALPAGTYLLRFRAAGTARADVAARARRTLDAAAPLEEQINLDLTQNQLIVCALDGRALVALELALEFGTEHEASAMVERASDDGSRLNVRLHAWIPSRVARRGFALRLALCAAPTLPDVDWR